jgi:translation initiation factor eIF-2B subunit epsilon
MYNSDVFTEKTMIFRWFADDRAMEVGEKGSEDMLSFRNASQKLITWLEEADEDSSEEEESHEE